jgi:hypothetical protein
MYSCASRFSSWSSLSYGREARGSDVGGTVSSVDVRSFSPKDRDVEGVRRSAADSGLLCSHLPLISLWDPWPIQTSFNFLNPTSGNFVDDPAS